MAKNPKIKDMKSNAAVPSSPKKDIGLWILVVMGIAAGIVANVYYKEIAWALRLAGWIVLVAVLTIIVSRTTQGKLFGKFANASRTELRKVVWPTRQETVRTTAIVIGLVVVAALILWGVDTLLLWVINFITG